MHPPIYFELNKIEAKQLMAILARLALKGDAKAAKLLASIVSTYSQAGD